MTEHINEAVAAGLRAVEQHLPDAKIIVLVEDDSGDGFGATGYSGPVEMRESLDKHAATVGRSVRRAAREVAARDISRPTR